MILIANHLPNLLRGILELVLTDIKFEIEEIDEGVGHLTHLSHVKRQDSLVEFSIFLIIILVKLHSESQSAVQYSFSVVVGKDGRFTSLFICRLKQPFDVDKRNYYMVWSHLLEELDKELNEFVHLDVTVYDLALIKNYKFKQEMSISKLIYLECRR